jgi:hypothetical protein
VEANTTCTKLNSDNSTSKITAWTFYDARLLQPHSKARLVVFKAPEFAPPVYSKIIGCIRVRTSHDTKKTLWDVVNNNGGPYLGLVPAGCQFEAMHVDIRIITPE